MLLVASLVGRLAFFLAGFVLASLVAGVGFSLFFINSLQFIVDSPDNRHIRFIIFVSELIGAIALVPAIIVTVIGSRRPNNPPGPYATLGAITGTVGSLLFFGVSIPFNIYLGAVGALAAYVFYFIAVYSSDRIIRPKRIALTFACQDIPTQLLSFWLSRKRSLRHLRRSLLREETNLFADQGNVVGPRERPPYRQRLRIPLF